jgi:phosphoribosylanthranilate isomerase
MGATAKICGLRTPEAVEAALRGGASHLGFIFFAKSPRNIDPGAAGRLAEAARSRAKVVAVTVDADDAAVDSIVAGLNPDLIQLHGRETPERAAEIRRRTGLGVVKALSVSTAADLAAASGYEGAADHLMFDAKAPADAVLPGGNGVGFDWDILAGRTFAAPWFLAGGLDAGNVVEAVRRSGAPLVDVSSGVESSPGVKDPALIQAFLDALGRAG